MCACDVCLFRTSHGFKSHWEHFRSRAFSLHRVFYFENWQHSLCCSCLPSCLPAFLTHSVQLWWTRSRETLLGHLWNVLRLIGWQHCNDKSHICGKFIFPIEWAACFFLKWVHEISNYTKWRKHEESVTFSYSMRKSNTDCFSLSAAQTSNAYNLWASIYVFKCISKSPQPATGLTEANIYAHFHICSQFRNNK